MLIRPGPERALTPRNRPFREYLSKGTPITDGQRRQDVTAGGGVGVRGRAGHDGRVAPDPHCYFLLAEFFGDSTGYFFPIGQGELRHRDLSISGSPKVSHIKSD